MKNSVLILTFFLLLGTRYAASQSIFSISPGTCFIGKKAMIQIQGLNTRFITKSAFTTVEFKRDNLIYVPDSINIKNNGLIIAICNFPLDAPLGDYSILVYDYTDGNLGKNAALKVDKPGIPYISSVFPDSIRKGQNSSLLYISGVNTNFTYEFGKLNAWLKNGPYIITAPYSIFNLLKTQVIIYPDIPANFPTGYYDVWLNDSFDSTIIYKNAVYINDKGLPAIKSFSPDTARRGQDLNLHIKGTNTYFRNKAAYGNSYFLKRGAKDSIAADSVFVFSNDSLFCRFKIPYESDTGLYTLYLADVFDGLFFSPDKIHLRQNLDRKLFSFTTNSNMPGTKVSAKPGTMAYGTASAINANYKSTTPDIWLSKDTDRIFAKYYQVTDANTIQLGFAIPATALIGKWDLNTKDSIDGILTLNKGFTVIPPDYPMLASVYPLIATREYNTSVKITGVLTKFNQNSLFFIRNQNHSMKYLVTDSVSSTTIAWAHLSPEYGFPLGNYTFYYVDPVYGGTLLADPFRIRSSSGIAAQDVDSLQFSVYPNPFRNIIVLKYKTEKDMHLYLELTDILGNRLKSVDISTKIPGPQEYRINLSRNEYKPGLYFLKIHSGAACQNFKLYKTE